ncbi:MAG: SpoIIE family protein phosphatase [Elusimicrobiota bacterium]
MELLVEQGQTKQHSYKITEKQMTIGRAETNMIVLNDNKVSRYHAVITEQDGGFFIKDLGSTNGTYVNNTKITEHQLQPGDSITIGDALFRVNQRADIPKSPYCYKAEPEQLLSPNVTIIRFSQPTSPLKTQDTNTLQKTVQNLQTLYKINNAISSIFDITELSNKIMAEIFSVINADRGYVILIDKTTGEWIVPVYKKRIADGKPDTPTISKSIVNRVIENGESILTSDAATDERFMSQQSIISFGISSAMCVPLRCQDRIIGVINVDTKGTRGSFTEEDLELLSAIGGSVGVALENVRLYGEFLLKQKLEQQMKLAAKIQKDLLPKKLPKIEGFQFAAKTIPAINVGGDYYDIVKIDEDHLLTVIADVSGKGISAALVMAVLRTLVRSNLKNSSDVSATVSRINELILQDLDPFMFITLFYALLDTKNQLLKYVNAGHTPAILVGHQQDVSLLEATEPAIGILPQIYTEKVIKLEQNDLLCLYTDGVSEINRSTADIERLKTLLVSNQSFDTQQIIDIIIADTLKQGPQSDDITLLVMKCQNKN